MKKLLSFLTLMLVSLASFAQDNAAGEPEMADKLYADGRIYVVVAVVVVVGCGCGCGKTAVGGCGNCCWATMREGGSGREGCV